MITYEDLQKCDTEEERRDLIQRIMNEHVTSKEYRIASDAELYFKHENPTINRVQKFIRGLNGEMHVDDVSPNNKIASDLYNYFAVQTVQYTVGNGITFENEDIKAQLGGSQLDNMLQKALVSAYNAGSSYAFFYDGKIQEIFKIAGGTTDPDFSPLKSEEDGTVKGGVRFWQIDKTKPKHVTVYEENVYTEYLITDGEWSIVTPTRGYTTKETRETYLPNAPRTVTNANETNQCPIIPLYYINRQSALVGNQNTIDAYDQTLSELVNGTQDDFVYWIFQNCAGMDETDAQLTLNRLREHHFGWADSIGEGGTIDFKTVQSPYEPRIATLERLEQQLYTDFKGLNPAVLNAGNKTATEIHFAYQPLDSKADEIEILLDTFMRQILQVAGLDTNESFHFTRSKVVNANEEITSVLASAQYLGEETTTRKILELLGMGDEFEAVQSKKSGEDLSYFTAKQSGTQGTTGSGAI